MAQSQLETVFESAAVKFNVAESDYLLLRRAGVRCLEDLHYRIPTKHDLEQFLEDVVHHSGAYRNEDGVIRTYVKTSPDWRLWRHSEDAGCLRKLWAYGSQVCKAELEDLASGQGSGEKIRITPSASRPSFWTLQKVANNYGINGKHLHLEWENFITLELEERHNRSGKSMKQNPAVFLKDGKRLEVQSQEDDLTELMRITGLVTLREALGIRARAFAMLGVASYQLLIQLTDKYTSLMRSSTPRGMRPPTINEIRRFDREMMKQGLRFKAEAQGDLDECLKYFLAEPTAGLWRLVETMLPRPPSRGRRRTLRATPETVLPGRTRRRRRVRGSVPASASSAETRTSPGAPSLRVGERSRRPRPRNSGTRARARARVRPMSRDNSEPGNGPAWGPDRKRADSSASFEFRLFEPWDILSGSDVFLEADRLERECRESDMVHFAPNCATFSRAREIPIKGVRDPPNPYGRTGSRGGYGR